MILEKLKEYAERIEQTPSMYKKKNIHWIIALNSDGRYLNIEKAGGDEGKKWKGKEYVAPDLVRTRAFKPILLADNAEYTLGISRGGSEEQAHQRHQTYLNALEVGYTATGESTLKSILTFLHQHAHSPISLPEDFDPQRNLTFSVEGIKPFELKSVQQWWKDYAAEKSEEEKDVLQNCMICGELRPVLKGHLQIKGIRGGQATLYVVSANATAFTSYGLESSQIAPTCQSCAEGYAKGLNALLAEEENHLHINNLAYCFWEREKKTFSFKNLLAQTDENIHVIKELLKAGYSGKHYMIESGDDQAFYALALSASGARVVVRDWIETTLGGAKGHLTDFFRIQQIVDPQGDLGYGFSLFKLSASLFREAKDIPAHIPQSLLHVALQGGLLPKTLLYRAVQRNRAEKRITAPRAALIRMLLIQHKIINEEQLIMLESDFQGPKDPKGAYQCGRLLYVLEDIQRNAIPGINATLTDRYFGTASSAPASVFGTLLRQAQSHLSKLRKDTSKQGTHTNLQQRLGEILGHLQHFPKTLTLEEQALFSLGYYHQRADNIKTAIANKQAKENKKNHETTPQGVEA